MDGYQICHSAEVCVKPGLLHSLICNRTSHTLPGSCVRWRYSGRATNTASTVRKALREQQSLNRGLGRFRTSVAESEHSGIPCYCPYEGVPNVVTGVSIQAGPHSLQDVTRQSVNASPLYNRAGKEQLSWKTILPGSLCFGTNSFFYPKRFLNTIMARQKPQKAEKANRRDTSVPQAIGKRHPFHLEFLNQAQKMAWGAFDQHDVLFLLGPAGCGKTHLACAFAISEILAKRKKKCVLTRPIVEAGEALGFLPGTFDEKVGPYMMPMYDCIQKCVGIEGPQKDIIDRSIEVAPIAYMRGRSQPFDAMVLTPSGYIPMGDIQIGDKVMGRTGRPTEVLGVYPQGTLDVYCVKFSDGTSVECSEDHLWSTMSLNQIRSGKYSTRTTRELLQTARDKWNRKVHRVPLTAPVEFSSRAVVVDPYVMGVILGDGNCHEKASVTITNMQEDVIYNVASRLPKELCLKLTSTDSIQYRVSGQKNRRNSIRSYFSECGLLGKRSYEKWVPQEYLYNSSEIRLSLLRGLMDTDGSIFKHRSGNCRIQYYSTSRRLAEAVRFLAHSFGGTASIRKREYEETEQKKIRHCRPCYVVDMVIGVCPFLCKEKASKYTTMRPVRLISAIEHVGKKECQCIKVAAADSLYLTDHFIVTHNTFDNAVCIFDEAQNATKAQLKLFMTRFGENSKIIITGDPFQSDLRREDQGLMHVVNRLEDLPGVGVIYFKASSIVRHPLIAAILEKLEAKEALEKQ